MKYITWIDSNDLIDSKDLVGGKGAGLKTIYELGLPVPCGFIITTDAWRAFNELGYLPEQVKKEITLALSQLELKTNKKIGNPQNPLLLSIRSGAKVSMPGMMQTILNVGLTEEILQNTGDAKFALDIFSKLVEMYAESIHGLTSAQALEVLKLNSNTILESVISRIGMVDKKVLFEEAVKHVDEMFLAEFGEAFPKDPNDQIMNAIGAVLESWYSPAATSFRQLYGISDDLGTAVVVQEMVFGNKNSSGAGVIFTRDTVSGKAHFIGDYLENGQGEDIVNGRNEVQTLSMDKFAEKYPEASNQLFDYSKKLEKYFKDVQDIEFTIEEGKVWLLQTRNAKRSPLANIRIANDLLKEKVISNEEAMKRISSSDMLAITKPIFVADQEGLKIKSSILDNGYFASQGVISGVLCLDINNSKELRKKGCKIIYVVDHFDPNNIGLIKNVDGIVTLKGRASSHMALIIRALGIPAIVGCQNLQIDYPHLTSSKNNLKLSEGDAISINADKGNVYVGAIDIKEKKDIDADLKNVIEKRMRYHNNSSWVSGLYNHENSLDLKKLLSEIEGAYTKASKKWKSKKATVIEVLNQVFSEKIWRFKSELVEPGASASLLKAIEGAINSGNSTFLRSCHNPEKLADAPYSSEIYSLDQAKDFIQNPDFPGKYGGYKKWISDKNIVAIEVPHEPKGKLSHDSYGKHFACTITCLNSNPPQLNIVIYVGSPHLREFEKTGKEDIIAINFVLNRSFDYNLGDITYNFGDKYCDQTKISQLFNEVKSGGFSASSSKIEFSMFKTLKEAIEQNPHVIDEKSFVDLIKELIAKEALSDKIYKYITQDKIIKLVDAVQQKITEFWKPPHFLPYRMTALDELLELNVLEAQGRFEDDKLIWFKIYGAKGAEEKSNVAKFLSK